MLRLALFLALGLFSACVVTGAPEPGRAPEPGSAPVHDARLLAVWCPEPGNTEPLTMARLFDPSASLVRSSPGLGLYSTRRLVVEESLAESDCGARCTLGGRTRACLQPCGGAPAHVCRLRPVFVRGSAVQVPTGRVSVRYYEGSSKKARRSIERRYNLRVVHRAGGTTVLYALESPRGGFAAFDVTDNLNNEPAVVAAEVEWLRPRGTRGTDDAL